MILEHVPWPHWAAFAAAVLIAAHAAGVLLFRRRGLRLPAALAAAFLAGILVGSPTSAAPGPAEQPTPEAWDHRGTPEGDSLSPAAPWTPAPRASGSVPPPTPTGTGAATVGAAPDPIPSGVNGLASWYCLPGRSACTRGYPPGPYAAAGPALRAALGDWRGRTVTVTAAGRSVTVQLVDWCACPGGRVIDLYADAFRELAPLSRGLVAVEVTW